MKAKPGPGPKKTPSPITKSITGEPKTETPKYGGGFFTDGTTNTPLGGGLASTVPLERIEPGKYRLDPLTVGYADTGTPGKLGMTICPGRSGTWTRSSDKRPRHLGHDLDYLKITKKTTVLVTLMETFELTKLEVPNLFEEAKKRGLVVEHFPIQDVNVPTDKAATEVFVKKLVKYIQDGENIVIHCKGGLGRTGTIAACMLVELGYTPSEAIKEVRRSRSPNAVETSGQEKFVSDYAAFIGAS